MKNLIEEEKEAIGMRIRSLRKLVSLTVTQLGKATEISKGTINSIESGRGFNADYILAISHFFAMELSELANYRLPLPNELEFRARIKEYHEKHESTAYEVLDEQPNLNAVIEFRLARTEFLLGKSRSVKEISAFCNEEYGLTLKSSILSQALKKAVDNEILVREPKDGKNYLYKARPEKDRK